MADYDPVKGCTGGPAPGATALAAWVHAHWPDTHIVGIFSCRNVRGGSGLSLHAEGRAIDVGVPVISGARGDEIADFVAGHAQALGVQELIWNKRIWTSRSPYWRPYVPGPGGSDHTDHVHIGLAWRTARDNPLTDALLNALGTTPAGVVAQGVGPAIPVLAGLHIPGAPGFDTIKTAAFTYVVGLTGLALVALGGWRLTHHPQEA